MPTKPAAKAAPAAKLQRLALSHTAIAQFEKCPLWYKTERIDKRKGVSSLPMVAGNFLHSVTEQYFRHLKATEQQSDFSECEAIFNRLWKARGSNKDHAILPETSPDGYDYQDLYDLMCKIREGAVIDPATMVEAELDLAFDIAWKQVDWFSKQAFFRAKVDRLDMPDAETAVIWDLKTGRKITNIKTDNQMPTYGFIVGLIFPEVKTFKVSLFYPRKGVTPERVLTAQEVAGVKDEIMRTSDRIEAVRASGKWLATPNSDCASCPLFKAGCPEQARAEQAAVVPPESDQEAQDLLLRLIMLKAKAAEVDARLKSYVDMGHAVVAGGMSADYGVIHSRVLKADEVWKVLEKAGLDPRVYFKPDLDELDNIAKRNQGLREAIEAITKDKPATRWGVKKVKDEDE